MIGERYWATGITVSWDGSRWNADVDFYDDGFVDFGATQGHLGTRYGKEGWAGLAAVVDVVKADAERLGIEFRHITGEPPALWVPGDGEDGGLPDGWQRQLADQAERLGWRSVYRVPEVPR
jgi:hypothetical protein